MRRALLTAAAAPLGAAARHVRRREDDGSVVVEREGAPFTVRWQTTSKRARASRLAVRICVAGGR